MADDTAPLHTILVVDDTAAIARVVADALNQEPRYQATAVGDAVQVLEVVQALRVDLFVMDFMMPGMDGLDLYERLQSVQTAKGVPVLFMTGDSAGLRRIRNRGLPVLRKPFQLEDLLKQVAALLESA